MKTLKHLMSILLLVMVAGACMEDQLVPEEKPVEGIPLSIEGKMLGYTKATDTSFEEGDAIGLYVYTPEIYMDNERFTHTDGKFVPATPQVWYEGDAESEFIACYPYQEKSWGKDRSIRFCVNADQRTHRNYTASDLMVARKLARPSADAVVLPFEHVLSKVLVTVENRLEEDIAEVMFSGVKGSFSYDIDTKQLALDGKQGIVNAARSNTDKTQWAMVLPPQAATPELVIITAGQKEYRYKLDKTFNLEGGRCHSATITVDAEAVSTEISSEIKDWLPGNDFNFGQDTSSGEWISLGTGTLIDDAVSPLLGLPVSILEVEVQENRNKKGLYRVVDPYKTASFYDRYASDTPGAIIIETDDSTFYSHLHDSYLGLKKGNQEFILFEGPEFYGVMDDADKRIMFNTNGLSIKTAPDSVQRANRNGFFQIILPGGNLPVMDQFDITGMKAYTDESGIDRIRVDFFVHMKYCKDILYRFYDTDVNFQEEFDKYRNGKLQMIQLPELKPGMVNSIVYTPEKSGRYSVLVVGKNTAGKDFAQPAICTYQKEGEVIPPPAVSLSATRNPFYPEGEFFLNIKVQDQIKGCRVNYAPVNDSTELQVVSMNYAPAGALQSPEGAVMNITNLKPSTEYKLIVSVTAFDDKVYRYETSCTTAPEASYTLMGEGSFIDNTQFIAWTDNQGGSVQNYESRVQIYQDNSNPDKFRMMGPYQNYWANGDPGFVRNQLPLHNGHESPYVDFYRYTGPDGRIHVAFSEIDTGLSDSRYPGSSYYYSALGKIIYNNVNQPSFVKSVELEEGLFTLNPVSAYIRNTPYFYGVIDFNNTLQIILPKPGGDAGPDEPGQGIAFDYFEVPQTLKAKQEYKYILHSGETYTSHQKVRNYSACYDTRRHNPMWVAYPCHDIWWEGGYGRPTRDPWRPDPQLKESEQSIIYANDWGDWPWSANKGRPTDNKQYWTPYNASFYFTKGHLLRSAERGTGDAYHLFKMNEQTFYPTNISPERYPTVKTNSGKKLTHWSLVEGIMPNEWRCSDTLYVVAGCYYGDDAYKAMDASDNGNRSPDSKDCIVPVARWKVFLRTRSGVTGKPVSECRANELMAIAFWFPQALEPSNEVASLPPLSDYTLSVDALEARIGGEFNFFPQVPAEVCKTFNASDWPGLDRIINVRLDANYSGPYLY